MVSDSDEKRSVPAKVLLDKGSQSTYIAETVVKALGLKQIKSQNVKINGFADKHGKRGRLPEYEFNIQNPTSGSKVSIKGLAVPFIAPRISGQCLQLAIEKFPELANLRLSDVDDDRNIDVLIGTDNYNMIVGDKKVRFGETGELVVTY